MTISSSSSSMQIQSKLILVEVKYAYRSRQQLELIYGNQVYTDTCICVYQQGVVMQKCMQLIKWMSKGSELAEGWIDILMEWFSWISEQSEVVFILSVVFSFLVLLLMFSFIFFFISRRVKTDEEKSRKVFLVYTLMRVAIWTVVKWSTSFFAENCRCMWWNSVLQCVKKDFATAKKCSFPFFCSVASWKYW